MEKYMQMKVFYISSASDVIITDVFDDGESIDNAFFHYRKILFPSKSYY
jgi:hypothetical protein